MPALCFRPVSSALSMCQATIDDSSYQERASERSRDVPGV